MLYVEDLAAAGQFFTGLGLAIVTADDEVVRLSAGSGTLVLHQVDDDDRLPPRRSRLYLRTDDPDTFLERARDLRAAATSTRLLQPGSLFPAVRFPLVADFLEAAARARSSADELAFPSRLPELVLACHNRRMIEVGAQHADGVLLNVLARDEIPFLGAYVERHANSEQSTLGMFQLSAFGDHAASLYAIRLVLSGFLRSEKVLRRLRWTGSAHADVAEKPALLEPGSEAAFRGSMLHSISISLV